MTHQDHPLCWRYSDHAAVASFALAIWEAEGRPDGHDDDHWFQAMASLGTLGQHWDGWVGDRQCCRITHTEDGYRLTFAGYRHGKIFDSWTDAAECAQWCVSHNEYLVLDARAGKTPNQMVVERLSRLGVHDRPILRR